jgi:hypothetical protein
MNASLDQALAHLNLQPGEVYQTTVDGRTIEVRALKTTNAEEMRQFADQEMLNLWLSIPPSSAAQTITVRRGKPLLPAPYHLNESDLAPE